MTNLVRYLVYFFRNIQAITLTSLYVLFVFLPWALNFLNRGGEIIFLIFKNFSLNPDLIKNLELIDKINNPPGFVILKSSSTVNIFLNNFFIIFF